MPHSSAPPGGGVVGILSWVLPLAGVLLWVFVLPSTRTLVRRRFEQRRPAPAQEPDSPKDRASTPSVTPRRREDDPEIRLFDHTVVVSKFTNRPSNE
jgi:hypothetical protein